MAERHYSYQYNNPYFVAFHKKRNSICRFSIPRSRTENQETVPVIEFRDPRVRPGKRERDPLHEELFDGEGVRADLGGEIVFLHDHLQSRLPTDEGVRLLSHLEKFSFFSFL